MILEESSRIDGRKLHEIRPITCAVGFLPRCHGSALFTRGQTQALAVATLWAPGHALARLSAFVDERSLLVRAGRRHLRSLSREVGAASIRSTCWRMFRQRQVFAGGCCG